MSFFDRFKRGAGNRWTPEQFWQWFQSPEGQETVNAFTGEAGRDVHRPVAALRAALDKVNPDLVWQIMPRRDGSPGAFEISAGGISELIPDVRALVDAAPPMADWHVVAFKQPSAGLTLQSMNPEHPEISSATVMCSARERPDGRFDLEVYLPTPAGTPTDTVGELTFMMLDATLGEFAVMTRIGQIQFDTTLVAPLGVEPLEAFAARILPTIET